MPEGGGFDPVGFWRRRAPGRSGMEACFRLLFDGAPEGMALLDAQGAVLATNPALARLVGPAIALRPGLPAVALLEVSARAAMAQHLAAVLKGVAAESPLLAGPADPSAPPDACWALSCHALPEDVRVGHVLLRVADQTEQRRTAARLAETERLELIGRVAGGVAHDFNNLLTAVLGSADTLVEAALPPALRSEIKAIQDAAHRGAALVRKLLATAGQQRMEPRVVDLNAAVEAFAPILERALDARVRMDLALERPGRRVLVDVAELERVLMNLAVNANAAMPGGGRLRIATGHRVVLRTDAAVPPGRWAVLEVCDTGTGIPAEALPRLFDPFFTTREGQGGTGLGLATVHGIVAQFGGHITAENRPPPEGGARFSIFLPRHEGTPEVAPPPPVITAREPVPRGAAPLLVVEDEAPLLRLACKALERAGFAVLGADSAEAALALVDAGAAPAALVSDVAMPGADGLELARRLRERWPALPVLLLSGYAPVALRHDLTAGSIAFLPKPYQMAELQASVAALVGGS